MIVTVDLASVSSIHTVGETAPVVTFDEFSAVAAAIATAAPGVGCKCCGADFRIFLDELANSILDLLRGDPIGFRRLGLRREGKLDIV